MEHINILFPTPIKIKCLYENKEFTIKFELKLLNKKAISGEFPQQVSSKYRILSTIFFSEPPNHKK